MRLSGQDRPHRAEQRQPEHNLAEFERLCREGPFETLAATGCVYLDAAYMAASHRGDF
jgi:hypothetical protein